MSDEGRPLLLWDGDCGFCAHWIERWRRETGNAVRYRPYQDGLADVPQVSEADCRRAVQLVLPDGRVLSAAHAVLTSLATAGRQRWLLRLYERSAAFRWIAEGLYRFVARHRGWLPRF